MIVIIIITRDVLSSGQLTKINNLNKLYKMTSRVVDIFTKGMLATENCLRNS